MISMRVNPSPALSRLTGQPAALVRRAGILAAKRAAEDYVDDIRAWIDAGRSFTARTGGLEQSVGWAPLSDGAQVYANAAYAGYVEEGTKAHIIRPKAGRKALRWFGGTPAGARFAKVVHHPGTPPLPFFFADFDRRQAGILQTFRETVAEVLLGGRNA